MVSMNVYGDPLLKECQSLYEQVVIGKILMKNGKQKRPLRIPLKFERLSSNKENGERWFRTPQYP